MAIKKLRTVEVGRGVAACSVVAFHANGAAKIVGLSSTPWAGPLQNGVDFFFVLSGFIIFYVHRQDIGRAELAGEYLWKRFVRLFPLLWFVACGWMVLRTLLAEPPSLNQIGTSLLLYPSVEKPIPAVVWTLRHELLFYLAFCVAIVNRWAGISLFAIWIAAVLAQMVLIANGTPLLGVPSLLLSSFVIDFVLGAGVALLADRWLVRSWVPLIVGAVLVIAFGALSVAYDFDRLGVLDYTSINTLLLPVNGLAFAILLYGMLCIEDMVEVPEWAMLLGAASYAIYLVHVPANSISQWGAAKLGEGFGHAVIFLVGVGAGVIVHLLIERRITRYLRARSPFASRLKALEGQG